MRHKQQAPRLDASPNDPDPPTKLAHPPVQPKLPQAAALSPRCPRQLPNLAHVAARHQHKLSLVQRRRRRVVVVHRPPCRRGRGMHGRLDLLPRSSVHQEPRALQHRVPLAPHVHARPLLPEGAFHQHGRLGCLNIGIRVVPRVAPLDPGVLHGWPACCFSVCVG